MYGETTPSTKAGVQKCTLEKFELSMVTTDKYKGPVLDIVFKLENGLDLSVRKFPIDKGKIASDLDKYPERFKKKDGTIRTVDDIAGSKMKDLSSYIKHIVTGFVTEDVWVEKINQWVQANNFVPGVHEPSFDQFVIMAKSMLPASYNTVEGTIAAGFKANSQYMEVPDEMYVVGDFFCTVLNPKKIGDPDTKYMKSVRWTKDNPNAPAPVIKGETDF